MEPRERDTVVSPASSGERQHGSGLRVQGNEGPLRLDAEQICVQPDSSSLSRSQYRSVCVTPDVPTSPILQLEARSASGSGRCLPTGLERTVGLCQPAMEPNRASPVDSRETGSGCGVGGTNMAITAMVPQVTQPAGGSTVQDSPTSRSDMGSSGRLPPGNQATPSRVAYLWQHYSDQKLSREASELLLSSWRQKSSKTYDSLCKKWISWCVERKSDPVSGPIEEVVNFLAHLYNEGYQYRSLNAYRSAIASMHTPIEGLSIGQHPLVSRLLKGVFQSRPPLPKYLETWDVSIVLTYLDKQSVDESLPLKLLSQRTAMLLALTRPARSADLSKLDISRFRKTPEGAIFSPVVLAKQSRPGRGLKEFFFPRFPENPRLCPVVSLELYLERTKPLRTNASQLFISFVKPHLPVSSSTVARWLKDVMGAAGIDISNFKAHSVRGASTSAAASRGITTEEILEAADWSTESSFRRFYYKPVRSTSFARSVLSATNNTIDM